MIKPQIEKELHKVTYFSSYVQAYLSEESAVAAIEISCEEINDLDLGRLEIRGSVFKDCTFQHCSFENASFTDVVFHSCDFSNSNFTDAYFERCQFFSCKCIGVDMSLTLIKQTAIEQSIFQYASFDQAKLTDVLFDGTDLTEASVSEVKLKKIEAKDSKFIRNNFFKTMLTAMDFSENEFRAPIVSMPPVELKGVIINAFQAAELIGMWGVVVKQ